jgi:hypothetical protein
MKKISKLYKYLMKLSAKYKKNILTIFLLFHYKLYLKNFLINY